MLRWLYGSYFYHHDQTTLNTACMKDFIVLCCFPRLVRKRHKWFISAKYRKCQNRTFSISSTLICVHKNLNKRLVYWVKVWLLKGQCHKIFDFRFFHESVSPKHLSIPLGPFRFLRKFAEIFVAQGAPTVSLTPVADEKSLQSENFSLFFMDTFGCKANI